MHPETSAIEVLRNTNEDSTQFPDISRRAGKVIGRVALALVVSFSYTAVETATSPDQANATATFANDYPNQDAALYDLAHYDWWVDENSNGIAEVTVATDTDDDESMSSRGYGYRNCTDGVAWWVSHNLPGYTVPRNWKNAISWDNLAPSSEVIQGNSNNIEPGDIAQSDGGAYGHVGFVTSVTKDASGVVTSFTTAELNQKGLGEFNGAPGSNDTVTYNTKNAAGNFIRTGTNFAWDHFIDVNGAGKGLNNEALGSSPPNTTPDTDGDGVVDSLDSCLLSPGLSTNNGCPLDEHTVAGNFYGNDTRTDLLSFYDLGTGNLGAYVMPGQTNGGTSLPQKIWETGFNQWNWSSSKFIEGNFAGNDNLTDVIGFFDYGNGSIGAWLFPGNGNGVGVGQKLWQSASNYMNLGNMKLLSGNFYGNDANTDVEAFYDYGSGTMGAYVFPGNGNGISTAQPRQWATANGAWGMTAAKYVAGNFAGNDSYTDIMAFYDLGTGNMGSYLMQGSSTGLQLPIQKWTTGTGQFNVAKADFVAGNFAGNDSNTDVVAFYDYDTANMGPLLFSGNGNGVNPFTGPLWTTGTGQWNWNKTKPFAGNFAGNDSNTDLVAFYDYDTSDTGEFLYTSSGLGGLALAQQIWRTGPRQWTWKGM